MKRNPVLESGVEKTYEKLLLSFYDTAQEIENGWMIVGDDEGNLIAMNSKCELHCIDRDSHKVTHYLNTSPEKLAMCIQEHKSYGECIGSSGSVEKELECVRRFESKLKLTDPEALAKVNSWWLCIVKQCYEGNL